MRIFYGLLKLIHLFRLLNLKDKTLNSESEIPVSDQRILKAYEEKCAVCGFDAKLEALSIGLEAAHIKWHTEHGPDVVVNGLALCSLHHKLFDRGAFTLSEERELLVSGKVGRSVGSEEWLMRFHGKQINLPQKEDDYPALEFIDWHFNEVFKGNCLEL